MALFKRTAGGDQQLATASTTHPLGPGQTQELQLTVDPGLGTAMDTFVAKVVVDPARPKFHQCRADDDASAPATGQCIQ